MEESVIVSIIEVSVYIIEHMKKTTWDNHARSSWLNTILRAYLLVVCWSLSSYTVVLYYPLWTPLIVPLYTAWLTPTLAWTSSFLIMYLVRSLASTLTSSIKTSIKLCCNFKNTLPFHLRYKSHWFNGMFLLGYFNCDFIPVAGGSEERHAAYIMLVK